MPHPRELLILTPADATPAERLALYRQRGITHSVLLLPWDSLSPLRQTAALQLAATWGRELTEVDDVRRDIAHTDPQDHEHHLVDRWLVRLLGSSAHMRDVQHWMGEIDRWKRAEEMDSRLRAFIDAWHQAIPSRAPPPPPGPQCPCSTCWRAYPRRRRRQS